MRRLLITLSLAAFCAPLVGAAGTAEAQVWKVKKNKAGAGTKTAAKPKPRPTRTARPVKKKRRAEKRKVELVPDEAEQDAAATDAEPREDEQPIFIRVEEVFD